jgi:hypothetical protein
MPMDAGMNLNANVILRCSNIFNTFRGNGRSHPKNIPSGIDNWYLDDFFEELICSS